jgi:hypothetical protein
MGGLHEFGIRERVRYSIERRQKPVAPHELEDYSADLFADLRQAVVEAVRVVANFVLIVLPVRSDSSA